jgi:hypothetical protein
MFLLEKYSCANFCHDVACMAHVPRVEYQRLHETFSRKRLVGGRGAVKVAICTPDLLNTVCVCVCVCVCMHAFL